jgi:hypothetical protein
MNANIDLRVYGHCCACKYGSQDISKPPCNTCKHIDDSKTEDNYKERTDI